MAGTTRDCLTRIANDTRGDRFVTVRECEMMLATGASIHRVTTVGPQCCPFGCFELFNHFARGFFCNHMVSLANKTHKVNQARHECLPTLHSEIGM